MAFFSSAFLTALVVSIKTFALGLSIGIEMLDVAFFAPMICASGFIFFARSRKSLAFLKVPFFTFKTFLVYMLAWGFFALCVLLIGYYLDPSDYKSEGSFYLLFALITSGIPLALSGYAIHGILSKISQQYGY